MTPERWLRIKSVLLSALELPSDQRSRFLDETCESDSELRADVESLLAAETDNEAGLSLEVTAWRDGPPADLGTAPPAPERAGPYKVVRRLGEGGMGVVYLAERDDGEYRREVAVKVIRPGADAARLAGRFRRERQILAGLQHPNIAQLMDGGTTSTGEPYYVMEFVDGVTITRFCQQRGLGLRRRLELFCDICAAVTHAHRNLVIHGDIKPGNILVTAAGVPKLLDFGLARVFKPGPGEAAAATVQILTPGYGSPEQVRGERLTTATDVYSLGVLLFEMLTGKRPYGVADSSPIQLCRAICDEQPRPPSAVLRDHLHHTTEAVATTPEELKGDLDNIVMMALRKEPEKRYGSVEEFRLDVERHLHGFPVTAAHGTTLYRVGKLIRRHRWGALASSLAALLLTLTGVATWWQGRQAEIRFNQVRSLANSVVFELHDAIRDLPGSTAARRLLVERALQYLQSLETTGSRNRDLQLELARAYDRIGEVQSSLGRANLGDQPAALESFTRARRILDAGLRSEPGDEAFEAALADVFDHLSNIYEQRGQSGPWRDVRRESAALHWKASTRRPGSSVLRAVALWHDAYTISTTSGPEPALAAWRTALDGFSAAQLEAPKSPLLMRNLARIHRGMAGAYQRIGKRRLAVDHLREALRIDSQRVADAPNETQRKLDLSWDYVELGWVEHELGLDREAAAHYEASLKLQQALAAADPDDSLAPLEIAKLKLTAAPAYRKAGRQATATRYLQEAARTFRTVMQGDPANGDARYHFSWALSDLGNEYLLQAQSVKSAAPYADTLRRRACRQYRDASEALAGLKHEEWLDPVLQPRKLIAHLEQRLADCPADAANQEAR